MSTFPTLRHFKRSENWGDPDKMDHLFLAVLDACRNEIDIEFYVSNALSPPGSHDATDSTHYPDEDGLCRAGDFFPLIRHDSKRTLFDCFMMATKYPFSGIGIYPYWRYTKLSPRGKYEYKGGLHLDTSLNRPMPSMRSAGHWIGIPNNIIGIQDEGQQYYGMSQFNLKRFGII